MRLNNNNKATNLNKRYIKTDGETFFRVEREVYTDQNIFKGELENIFDKCWLYAFHKSEISGDTNFLTRQIGGRPVLITKDNNGVVTAFLNSCNHRGAIVCSQEKGNSKKFTCPYHGWQYNQKGKINKLPGKDAYGSNCSLKNNSLYQIKMQHYRGFYFLHYSEPEVSLQLYLGNACEYLDMMCDQSESELEIIEGAHKHDINANWKLLAENGVDAYHLPFAHKRFLDWIDDLGATTSHTRTGIGLDLGNGHSVIKSGPPSTGRPIAYWSPLFSEDMKPVIDKRWKNLVTRFGEKKAYDIGKTNRSLFIFPNVVFNDILGLNIRTFFPNSENNLSITVWGAGFKDESEQERKYRINNLISFIGPAGFGTPDDVEILESCQRSYAHKGLSTSDFSRGMASNTNNHTDEAQNRAFWKTWSKHMESNYVMEKENV